MKLLPSSDVSYNLWKRSSPGLWAEMNRTKSKLPWVVGLCFASCLFGIAAALWNWGATEVRANAAAVFTLTLIGTIWILLTFKIFPWLGLSYEYDVTDCGNTAAMIALCGAMIAVSTLYAGGSLGEGPSYLENFFSAGLGTSAWVFLWLFLEMTAKVSVSITEDRDLASGLRFCGLLVATGVLLGRATAGNWVSEVAAIRDLFRDGWPAAALLIIAVPVEWQVKPRPARPLPSWMIYGALPALFYLGLAVIWLWHLGRWEGMPQ